MDIIINLTTSGGQYQDQERLQPPSAPPPMLAAAVKVSGVVEPNRVVQDMKASFEHKFATKPQVIDGNMKALTQSMEEVQFG